MPRLTDDIPSWVGSYVGLPFLEHGRDRGGVDCWGLLRLVYAERYGIFLPSHHDGYAGTDDAPGITAVLDAELGLGVRWRPRGPGVRLGDALLFHVAGVPHVGVAVGRGRMLHCRRGSDSCVERFDVGTWSPRLGGAFEFVGPVMIAGRLSPLRPDVTRVELPAGGSISELMAAAGIKASPFLQVWIGDRRVPREHWDSVRPRPGRSVRIAAVPAGGGGDGEESGGKTALRVILVIAVVALAIWTGGAAAGALTAAGYSASAAAVAQGVVAASVTLAGTLAINALIPPPKPRLSDNSSPLNSPTITGARNELRPYGVVPTVLGTHRMAPLYGAKPYTEIVGDDQYLRVLFIPSTGPVEISDLKIGDTPLSEYEGVEVEVRGGRAGDAPLSIYPGVVLEDSTSLLLEQIAGWSLRTTDTAADEVSIDLTWPQGLVEFDSRGRRKLRTVSLDVEYSPTGANAWTTINGSSPDFTRGMDFLFRTPENIFGGEGEHAGDVQWGLGFSGTKPAYLPATGYSWEVEGYVYAERDFLYLERTYEFAIDCSDAGELWVDDQLVASWYGSHSTAGGATPVFTHTGSIDLLRGWHKIKVRIECRSTTGAVAIGWKIPDETTFVPIPASSLASRASDGVLYRGKLAYRWFDTSRYLHTIFVQADRPEQIRRSLSWAVPRGQYDVRIRRVTPDTSSDRILDKVYWTALRTIRAQDPVKPKGVAKIALRIRATDQLNGVVDQLNCVVRSILPDWDAALGRWVLRATNNPASCYRAVLQGRGNARPVPDERIDLAELQAWHEACAAAGFEFNGVLDFAGTVFQRLADIAATGRASFGMRDGKYSIVRDRVQSVPVQHFTPRNSAGFKGRKAFPDLPHALRIRFLNENVGYQQDERIVYDDGWTAATATKFETMELFGVTLAAQVWKHGRYLIASARLRPEVYELSTDIEHLACTRGDLVLVTHDVPLWGLTFGRVVALVLDQANNLIGLRLDELVTMDATEAYVIRVRLEDGTSWIRPVTTVAGESMEVAIGPVSANDPRPKVGDLWMFGRQTSESRELIVKSIEVDKDLGARLELVDHAPAVHQADQGPIPPFDPGISLPPVWSNGPDAPVIESIRSDDYVMIREPDGSLRDRMLITLRRPSGTRPIANAAQVRIRPIPAPGAPGEGPWMHLPLVPIDDNQISVERVEAGITYQIRLRTVTASGLASAWVSAEHTVIGKTLPPPDVQSFNVQRLSDGTRRFTWDLGTIPPDIAGVVIRYSTGGEGRQWAQLAPLHQGILEGASPTDLNVPSSGLWTFGIKMVDTSGNESRNAVLIDRTLGPARQEGIAVSVDAKADGWPGTKTGCYVSNDRTLVAAGRERWDTLASIYGVTTWAQYSSWTLDPTTPIVYQQAIDAGFVFEFEPAVVIQADGVRVVEVDHSLDGVTWAGWATIESYSNLTIRARHVRFRVTLSIGLGATIPILRELVMQLRAPTIEAEIQDLVTSAVISQLRYGVGDVALPIPIATFAAVRNVALSFNGMGAGWTWELVNRNVSPGPRVRLYNPAGVLADATIDAIVRGIAL
ncbi:MAG: host specificity factor TipJ family phage tail protein [Phycisphaerales bacterium]